MNSALPKNFSGIVYYGICIDYDVDFIDNDIYHPSYLCFTDNLDLMQNGTYHHLYVCSDIRGLLAVEDRNHCKF